MAFWVGKDRVLQCILCLIYYLFLKIIKGEQKLMTQEGQNLSFVGQIATQLP